jgi:hypothetical protein
MAGTYILLIGNDTRLKRRFVLWETEVAIEKECRLIGVNLDNSRRVNYRTFQQCSTMLERSSYPFPLRSSLTHCKTGSARLCPVRTGNTTMRNTKTSATSLKTTGLPAPQPVSRGTADSPSPTLVIGRFPKRASRLSANNKKAHLVGGSHCAQIRSRGRVRL